MRTSRARGFTLVEVLVALAVVAFSMAAMYSMLTQVVAAVTIMQDRTLATWIAVDRITEIRVTNEFVTDDEQTNELEMGGLEWVYVIQTFPTQSEDIRRVLVKVALADDPDTVLGMAAGAIVRPVTPANPGIPGAPGGPGGPPGGSTT